MCWKRIIGTLALAAMLGGCSDLDLTDGNGNGSFPVTVGAGTRPTYSWTADPAFHLDVVALENPLISVWAIAAPGGSFPSPVTHGTVPAGAQLLANVEPTLRAGTRYRVTITLLDNERSSREFRP